jgi:enediyne biosynthesis protein E4
MNRRRFIGSAAASAAGLLSSGPSRWLKAAQTQIHQSPSGTIQFEEVAQRSGLHFVTTNSATPNKHQIETMTGGVALLDYDGDGYLDIYLVNGAAIPSLVKESPLYWNRLFHNNRDGTFTDVTERAGVAGTGYGMGVAVGDFDNDGRPDLFVANVNGNQLFHNNGDGSFTDITNKAGLSGALLNGQKMWSVGGGWFDYNNDGLLDLFVVNYCQWGIDKDPICLLNSEVRGYCHPRFYAPLQNTLYRNNGDGTFTDVSQEMGIAGILGKGMSVSFADFDGDGFMDAFVANDTTRNLLFHNRGGKRFEERSLELGVAYNAEGKALSGMGSDFRDVNNDGRPDIWHTAIEHETLPLYLNRGTGFSDESAMAGLALATANMSGWGNGIFDFDNDGWKDLFVARSNVIDNISAVYPNRRYAEPNSVFRNLRNGKFQDVSATAGPDLQLEAAHRGVAFGDLDNDGRIDAVVTVLNGPVKIFRNISTGENHWILLNLVGTKSSRMPIGAQIQAIADDGSSQWNQVTTAVGYASSSDSRVHFGLGKNRHIRELQIRWPSGIRQQLRNVEVDRVLTIEEPRS